MKVYAIIVTAILILCATIKTYYVCSRRYPRSKVTSKWEDVAFVTIINAIALWGAFAIKGC